MAETLGRSVEGQAESLGRRREDLRPEISGREGDESEVLLGEGAKRVDPVGFEAYGDKDDHHPTIMTATQLVMSAAEEKASGSAVEDWWRQLTTLNRRLLRRVLKMPARSPL